MIKIRKASCFDRFRLRKMISFLSDSAISHYTKVIKPFPYMTVHNLLPLQLKFLPETFIMEKDNEILGMISVSKTHGNAFKQSINRLYLEKDYYNIGKQLIDFVISKYGAKGASSFNAIINDSNEELLQLFTTGCGFRQCSSEQLRQLENPKLKKSGTSFIRPFRSSDAKIVANIFNESILTHFKYTISRTAAEYREPFFKFLQDKTVFKYISEDSEKKINAYFSIISEDNKNFVLTITSSPWLECNFEDIICFAQNEARKRNKNFEMFIRVRKYTTTADALNKFLDEHNAKFIQNQIVLVKDFYKEIKQEEKKQQVLLFNEFTEKPVFKARYE